MTTVCRSEPEIRFDPDEHRFWDGERELLSVTRVLHMAGLIHGWGDDYHMQRGTAVHLACQLDDEGDLDEETLDEVVRPYLTAWRRFRDESSFKPEMIEHVVFDTRVGYAGILDRMGILGAGTARECLCLLDIKTGTAMPDWCALQTAAYRRCFQPLFPFRFGVLLKPDGKYSLHEFKEHSDGDTFLSALRVAQWKLQHGGGSHD